MTQNTGQGAEALTHTSLLDSARRIERAQEDLERILDHIQANGINDAWSALHKRLIEQYGHLREYAYSDFPTALFDDDDYRTITIEGDSSKFAGRAYEHGTLDFHEYTIPLDFLIDGQQRDGVVAALEAAYAAAAKEREDAEAAARAAADQARAEIIASEREGLEAESERLRVALGKDN